MRWVLTGLAAVFVAGSAAAQTQQEIDWCKTGTDDQKIAGCSAIAARNPSNAVAYYNRGYAYGRKGLYDQAIADYTQAIALNPSYADAYDNRGAAYGQKGLRDQAIADYRAALKLAPDNKSARDGLVRLGATP